MDRRRDRGAQTRRRLVEATLALLTEQGPDAYSASALATRAGVSKAALFHHFPRLDEAPLEAAELLFSESIDIRGAEGASPGALVAAIGRKALRLTRQHAGFLRAYLVFLVKGLYDERYRDRVAAGVARIEDDLRRDLDARLPDAVPAAERAALTHLLAATLDGLGLHYLLRSDASAFRKSWKLLADALEAKYERDERRES